MSSLQEFYDVFAFYLFVSFKSTSFSILQLKASEKLQPSLCFKRGRVPVCLLLSSHFGAHGATTTAHTNYITKHQGWFIFTFLMLMCTLKSTVAFFLLFLFLDLAFLMLAIGYLDRVNGEANTSLVKAGGYFGIFSAFAAWYNALAGILDRSNSFFLVPVAHFPWSEKGREKRGKATKKEEDKA